MIMVPVREKLWDIANKGTYDQGLLQEDWGRMKRPNVALQSFFFASVEVLKNMYRIYAAQSITGISSK